MRNLSLKNNICETFCPYYKPSRNKDIACQGVLIIKKLKEKGTKIPFKKPQKKLDKKTVKLLEKDICTECPFYENDCDFAQKIDKALPCGGFILLGHLFDTHIITIDDIKEIN